MGAGRRVLGAVSGGGSGAIPSGYAIETAAVAYASKRTFTVAREAQCDYGPGTPICLLQQGKVVPAVVQTYTYNGTTMTITPNVSVDSTFIGVARDTSAPFIYGTDPNYISNVFHFETATLYDSSKTAADQNTTGITLLGAAPTVITSSPTPKFGSQCYQIVAGTAFYGGSGGYASVGMPLAGLGSGLWCWEMWVYGQPSGYVSFRRGSWYSGMWSQGYMGFSPAGYPVMNQSDVSSGVFVNITNATPTTALAWNHVVWCRDSTGNLRTAVNGVFGGSSGYGSPSLGGSTVFGYINSGDANNYNQQVLGSFGGIIDEFRVTSGFCPYQGGYAFTPPAKPFGPDYR